MKYTYLPLLLLCAGCATTTEPTKDYSGLYDGRPTAAFATEMPTASALEALARGDQAYRKNEIDRALYLYLQAIELDPSAPDAFYRMGVIHEQRGKLALAANAFKHVLARDESHIGASEKLGLVLLDQRDLASARKYLQFAITADSNRYMSQNGLGVISDLEGNHGAAAEYFRRALESQPDSARILNNLGYSLYLSDQWDAAEQTLHLALEKETDYELAIRNLALIHARRGEAQKSLQLLLRVTSAAKAHNDVGYLCMLDGQSKQATRYLRKAIELSPSYYELAHRNLERNKTMARAAAARSADVAKIRSASVLPETPVATVRPTRDNQNATNTPLYLKRWVSADILNVREASQTDAALLDKLRRGRVVRILRQQDEWAYVRYWDHTDGAISPREGWVHSTYLSEAQSRA